MRQILLLVLILLAYSAIAQNAPGAKTVEQIYYLEVDGVVVKITVEASPKVMNKMLGKELRIRRKLVGIHQHRAKILQNMADIYRELGIHCPGFEKKLKQRKKINQQAMKNQRKKLRRAKKKRNALKSGLAGKKGMEDEKTFYQRLDRALERAVEESEMPEMPLEEDENSLENDEIPEANGNFYDDESEPALDVDSYYDEMLIPDVEFYDDESELALDDESELAPEIDFYDDESELALDMVFYDDESELALDMVFYDDESELAPDIEFYDSELELTPEIEFYDDDSEPALSYQRP